MISMWQLFYWYAVTLGIVLAWSSSCPCLSPFRCACLNQRCNKNNTALHLGQYIQFQRAYFSSLRGPCWLLLLCMKSSQLQNDWAALTSVGETQFEALVAHYRCLLTTHFHCIQIPKHQFKWFPIFVSVLLWCCLSNGTWWDIISITIWWIMGHIFFVK